MAEHALWRRLVAEFLGSAFLAAVVVGSGIAAQHLRRGHRPRTPRERGRDRGGPLRHHLDVRAGVGRPFQPRGLVRRRRLWRASPGPTPLPTSAPRLPGASQGRRGQRDALACGGDLDQTWPRQLIFCPRSLPTSVSLLVIFALARTGRQLGSGRRGAYIGAAYFFTSSTSFANPAITLGRTFSTRSPASHPSSVPSFIGAQLVGAVTRLPC